MMDVRDNGECRDEGGLGGSLYNFLHGPCLARTKTKINPAHSLAWVMHWRMGRQLDEAGASGDQKTAKAARHVASRAASIGKSGGCHQAAVKRP